MSRDPVLTCDWLQAAHHGHAAVVQLLLGAGDAEVAGARNKYGGTALHMAAAGGHLATVRLLVGAGCPVEEAGQSKVCPTPAMTAALHGHDTVLGELVDSGAKPDKVATFNIYQPKHLNFLHCLTLHLSP